MKTLARRKSRFGLITIEADKRGAIAYCQGGYYQSYADANGVSLLIYVQAIFGLLAQTRSENVLMIGCAGGSLAAMLAREGRAVTAVDINPQAFLLARRYFHLPDAVDCRVADGLEFLLSSRRSFDAIVLDAFQSGDIADAAFSQAFYAQVKKHLRPKGAVFANVHVVDDRDDAADRVAVRMAEISPHVRILDRAPKKYRNAIVMAGAVRGLTRPKLLMKPEVDAPRIAKALASMRFRRRCKAG